MSTVTIGQQTAVPVGRSTATSRRAPRRRSLRAVLAAIFEQNLITSQFVEESGDLSRPQELYRSR